MQGLATAILDRALPAGPSDKGAPEWVHLLPTGFMKGRDGRSYDLADPGGLILAFQANGIDLPVDFEHQNDKPEARLKGPVEWTASAAEMIGAREYRYLFKPSGASLKAPDRHTRQVSDLETAVCEQLGLKPGALRD